MKVVKFIFFIIFTYLYILLPNSSGVFVKSDDDATCLFTIVQELFSLLSVTICGSANYTNVYYKTTCSEAGVIDSLEIRSNDESVTEYLTYNHLSCFKNVLSQLTLFRLKINSNNPFGYDDSSAVSKEIKLTECIFSDGEFPLVTSGKSLPAVTQKVEITISQISNFKKLRFTVMKYVKDFFFYLVSGMKTDFVEFVNELQDSNYEFNTWSIQTNNVPSFSNTKIGSLYLGIVESTSEKAQTSFGNLDTFNLIGDLHFIFDNKINFPTQLSSPNNKFQMLNMVGPLTTSSYVTLPPTLKRYQQVISSPTFNINGYIPFSSFPETLISFYSNDIGIKYFPTFPTTIQYLYLNSNNFSSELPDFSSYSKLIYVEFLNAGFIGQIKESYCNFQSNLANNNLNGTLPQCKSCYIDGYLNYYSGNPNLSFGTCEPGSIIPNQLKYDANSGYISLTGVNLGLNSPILYYSDKSSKFEIVTVQTSFRVIWSSLAQVPDTLLIGLGSRNFTLATKPLMPSLDNSTKTGKNQYTFIGSNFSYNKAEIMVKIAGVQGTITFIDFNTIIVKFNAPDPLPIGQNIPGTITNIAGNLIKDFMIDTREFCDGNCVHGDCDTNTGECACNNGWIGKYCDQVAPLQCSSDCGESLGKGSCNTTIGECSCIQKWIGNSCQIPNQFLTSASSTFTNGGIVNLIGWFGTPNDDLSIKIGNLNCEIKTYNETFANCSIGAGSGTKSITVSQNGKTYTANNLFHYDELVYKCPKDCSLNGIQNGECIKSTGECKCYQNWAGYDCNSLKIETSSSSTTSTSTTSGGNQTPSPTLPPIEIPKSNTTVSDLGSTTISNQQTSYEISILSLVELDILDNVVLVHNLTNKWISNEENKNNIHSFTQNIGESCTLVYTIEDVKETREFQFAGLKLSLDKDTVKMTVKINNYPFTNALNKLQLRIESLAGEKNNSNLNNQCNNKETEIDTGGLDKDQLLNYITISKNEKILYGRFINRVLSDTRESFITTTLISNSTSTIDNKQSFIIGLNLPFFTNSLVIDPDFSVLTSPSFKKCNSDGTINKRASWVLPVAIVVPCVGVAVIIIITAVLIKKNRTSALLFKNKLKLKSLSKRNSELYMPTDTTKK